MKLIIKLLISTLAVTIGAWLLPGVSIDSYLSAFFVAAVLILLNVTVKPVLVIFTLPATIFTLGLFLIVINTIVILMADWLVGGLSVDGFWWALLYSIILSIINSIFQGLTKDEKKKKRPLRKGEWRKVDDNTIEIG